MTADQIAGAFASPEFQQHWANGFYLRYLDQAFGAGDAARGYG